MSACVYVCASASLPIFALNLFPPSFRSFVASPLFLLYFVFFVHYFSTIRSLFSFSLSRFLTRAHTIHIARYDKHLRCSIHTLQIPNHCLCNLSEMHGIHFSLASLSPLLPPLQRKYLMFCCCYRCSSHLLLSIISSK